ncbi:phosphopyruvate hydratase [Candidatus Woesearchaeota archaeon]|jgi:enolase|nr:phosphopyruvate hydratase [Candidatus Woesearchaeota archaeon]MBT4368744.1 phosphopyruvate hydratase [Candidatus Woesearchaeota archaeon]MBT4712033.1 phosphopyruvate hydratase [Candidatus Woesearchaeota archaeon]MBT6639219.1 phosphopyruvate hydratase [Candidatus Woesearchaeota archaeon]MBT7134419.1 phosphopyruvate hydratase [Candidatus Woesearchaeota archaeon]
MYTNITKVIAREILDSRGTPTIEVDLFSKKIKATASVPSGASVGIHAALELRDHEQRYFGKGVKKAVANVNTIIFPAIKGMSCFNQKALDNFLITLDGTPNKAILGANAILAVSLANARLASKIKNIPLYKHISKLAQTKPRLPTPFFNVINGGKHSDSKLAIQEFMIVPKSKSFKQALRMGSETYHMLKHILEKRGANSTNVGDEGGFVPNIATTSQALRLLTKAIKAAGYEGKIKIAMDAAATSFFKRGKYKIDKRTLTKDKLVQKYRRMLLKYPIISLEDPFYEEDFISFAKLTKLVGKSVQIVGDDLLVTNIERMETAIKAKSCNCLLLKVNQIGTLTEAINAFKLAKKQRWNVMVSHRSGETEDSFIADLVVGLGAGQIKSGAPCRSERLAKYNQLLRIEEEL